MRSLEDWGRDATARTRFESLLFTAFGAVALLLVAGGLSGTLLYMVGRRRRELGIRLALGDVPARLARRVLWSGVRIVAVGSTVGVAGAWAFGRLLESHLFGVEPSDLLTTVGPWRSSGGDARGELAARAPRGRHGPDGDAPVGIVTRASADWYVPCKACVAFVGYYNQERSLGTPESAMSDPAPMSHVDDWEESLAARYPATTTPTVLDASAKPAEAFRDYTADVRPAVREFYRLNHRNQTLEFVLAKKRQYLPLRTKRMGIWEAMEFLNTLVDDSDPDTDFSQIEHLMQTAEAIRRDGHPRWFILTGLIHDLGKILCLYGEPQWAVVGDTFPVGCAFSDKVVYSEFFSENPDWHIPEYQTPRGIYPDGCGLGAVNFSWGHDEYLYQVVKDHLPEEALAMIRYHSCYAIHREGAYGHLLEERDRELMHWVRAFNPYDLYSKGAERPDVAKLRPYYQELIAEWFPPVLDW